MKAHVKPRPIADDPSYDIQFRFFINAPFKAWILSLTIKKLLNLPIEMLLQLSAQFSYSALSGPLLELAFSKSKHFS